MCMHFFNDIIAIMLDIGIDKKTTKLSHSYSIIGYLFLPLKQT